MRKSALGGFAAGVLAMYFADPRQGRRRRAEACNRLVALWHDVSNELDKAQRDGRNRVQGLGARIFSLWRQRNTEAEVLLGRVRSAIGRAVSHPHAIHARIEGRNTVILEGPVLRHELDELLRRVRAVRGAGEIVHRLEVHSEPDIASLQGGAPRRALSEIAQQNWTPSLRVASGALAGGAAYASTRIKGLPGWLTAAGSAALFARAAANRPFRQLFGFGGNADVVHFDKTIHIHAPVDEIYAYWANFENFPKFMSHLKEVRRRNGSRSHWVAAGPGGLSIPWEAEIVEQRTNQLLAWRSVPGSIVRTAGVVRFDPEGDGITRLQIRMSYCPPAGIFGHIVAWILGADPKTEMDDDLVRLKSLLETGKTRAHGTVIRREQLASFLAGQPQPGA
jgi:uncharacterized membrane protein